jgi:hypothetical protein
MFSTSIVMIRGQTDRLPPVTMWGRVPGRGGYYCGASLDESLDAWEKDVYTSATLASTIRRVRCTYSYTTGPGLPSRGQGKRRSDNKGSTLRR